MPGFRDGADEELADAGAGLVLVAGDVDAPGEDRATGVVVTPPGEADGASPCPAVPVPRLLPLMPPPLLRPEGPPCAGPGPLADALCVDPPAGLADDGPWCGPEITPTTMAAAITTRLAAPATMACGWCRIRCQGPAPGGLTGLGKPWGPNGPARFATARR